MKNETKIKLRKAAIFLGGVILLAIGCGLTVTGIVFFEGTFVAMGLFLAIVGAMILSDFIY